MSLVLGKNPSNELKEITLDTTGAQNINLQSSSVIGGIDVNNTITADNVGLATEATAATLATESTLSSVQTDTGSLAGCVSGTELQVDVVSSALPAGAATSALQTTGNTSLAAIDTNTTSIDTATTSIDGKMSQGYDAQIASGGSGAQQVLCYGRDNSGNLDALKTTANGNLEVEVSGPLGSDVSANSVSVVIASDQTSIPVSSAGGNTTNVNESLAGTANGTANSTAVDMNGATNLTIFGTSTNTSDPIVVQVSHNNSTWVEHTEYFVNFSPSGGAYAVRISAEGARYFRVSQTDTTSTAFTLVVNSSSK